MNFDLPMVDSESGGVEVLNNVLDTENINMKTRMSLEQIRIDSLQYYLKLTKLRKKDGTIMFNHHQCFSKAMEYIKQLLVSKDDKDNRVIKVIEGVKSMEVIQNQQGFNAPIAPSR